MTASQMRFGYVYGGTVTFGSQVRKVEGTAWSLGRCDEVRLRAAAVRDVARTENIPLAGIEIRDGSFWYSEISVAADLPHPCTDPFGSRSTPPTPDPFRPGPGTPCPEDI